MTRIIYFLPMLILLTIPLVFAQGIDVNDTISKTPINNTLGIVGDFSIHIPDKMISDTKYEAMILLREPNTRDLVVSLATNNRDLDIPSTVTVNAKENHAIFSLTPSGDKQITIHAISTDGDIKSATSSIHSIAARPTKVLISAPTSGDSITTRTDTIPIKIFLTDTHGIPIASRGNTLVHLTSTSSAVQFHQSDTSTVIIKNGTYSTDVILTVRGKGIVVAAAQGLQSDTLDVEYDSNVVIKLGVAPNPAVENSLGFFYVWLEQDDTFYKPNEVLDIYLTTSDSNSLRFTPSRLNYNDDTFHTHLKDGLANGIFYNLNPKENVFVTATIPDIGSVTQKLEIVPRIDEIVSSDQLKMCGEQSIGTRCANVGKFDPNKLKMWVFPDTPTDTAHAVIATYVDIDSVDNGNSSSVDIIEGSTSGIIPTYSNYDTITLSSDGGINYDTISLDGSQIEITSEKFRSSAISIPLNINTVGDHILKVNGDEFMGDSVEFTSTAPFGFDYNVEITPIPSNLGISGDIAFVSVIDDTGAIVDVGAEIDTDKINVIQIGDSLEDISYGKWIGGTTIVTATHLTLGAQIFVQIPGISSTPQDIDISGVQSAIEIWHPSVVNVLEEFPVAIYAVTDDGIPTQLITDDTAFEITSEQIDISSYNNSIRFTAQNQGSIKVTILADRYIGTSTINSFANKPDSIVHVKSKTPSTIRLGTDIILDIFTGQLQDPSVYVDGLDFHKDEFGRYVATPEEQGVYHVEVQVNSNGWDTYLKTIDYTVEKLIDVKYIVLADDGVNLSTSITLKSSTDDTSYIIKNGVTKALRPGIFEISSSKNLEIGSDRIYTLQDIKLNDAPLVFAQEFTIDLSKDSIISSEYQREITVDFIGLFNSDIDSTILGSDMYRYLEIVQLNAKPQSEFYFLIWYFPVEWVGLPDDAIISPDNQRVQFAAINSASGHVEYQKNYGVIIILIASLVVVPVTLVIKKSPDTLLDISDIFVALKSNLKLPKRKKK